MKFTKSSGVFKSEHLKKFLMSLLCYLILISVSFLIIYPLLQHIAAAFKSKADLLDKTVVFLAKSPTLSTIKDTMKVMQYSKALYNSLLLSTLVALLQTFSSTMIGYGFARYKFPLRNFLFGIVIFTIIVPVQVIMSSYFMNFRFFDIFGVVKAITGSTCNLIDSYAPFVLLSLLGLGLKNGLYIYLLRQFFRGIPNEFEEAADIDGAGFITIFMRVMLPNALPMMVTVFLFSFSWQWSDTYYTSIFFNKIWVLPSALASLETYGEAFLDTVLRSAMLSTGLLLVIAPLLILYILLQKFFIQGVSRSGIVG